MWIQWQPVLGDSPLKLGTMPTQLSARRLLTICHLLSEIACSARVLHYLPWNWGTTGVLQGTVDSPRLRRALQWPRLHQTGLIATTLANRPGYQRPCTGLAQWRDHDEKGTT